VAIVVGAEVVILNEEAVGERQREGLF